MKAKRLRAALSTSDKENVSTVKDEQFKHIGTQTDSIDVIDKSCQTEDLEFEDRGCQTEDVKVESQGNQTEPPPDKADKEVLKNTFTI